MAQLNAKFKKGDEVIIITGKDKGKSGKIVSVLTELNRVVVEGLNQVKKHISQREAMRLQREPGVTTKDMPIAVSNVMLKDPKTGAPTRIGYQIQADGAKVRVAKKSGTVLDTVTKSKAEGKKPNAKTSTSAPKAKSKK